MIGVLDPHRLLLVIAGSDARRTARLRCGGGAPSRRVELDSSRRTDEHRRRVVVGVERRAVNGLQLGLEVA
jgi:hypothetical protein